jgi:5-formyltetrahydrofolate cyclo-ligase
MAHLRAARKWSYLLSTKTSAVHSKADIRKILRDKNLQLDASQRQLAAVAAENFLLASPLFQKSQHIACYIAHGGEFDLQAIIKAIWVLGKKCYLPVLAAGDENKLHFVEYAAEDDLQTNKYNILEPRLDVTREIPAANLDLALLPLTAFDKEGYRLGKGGGYYDKTFGFLLGQSKSKKPRLVGVGFSHQEVAALPHDSWDIKLCGALTEKKLILF